MSNALVPIKVIQTQKGELIPFWKLRCENYGDKDSPDYIFEVPGEYVNRYFGELKDAYWDCIKKQVVTGIVKDIYPKEGEYSKYLGPVMTERSHHVLQRDEIIEIIYEEYDVQLVKGKNISNYQYFFSKEELNNVKVNDLFEIRIWKPWFKTKSGNIIKYQHQIYLIAE